MATRVIVFVSIVLVVLVLPAHPLSIEDHIDDGYIILTNQISYLGYTYLAASDLARYAILRQLLEDGITRPHNISIVGMVVGGRNKQIMSLVSLMCTNKNKISTVKTSEGTRCYAIYGENAYILSGVGIAEFYDRIINECRDFTVEEIELWNRCKYDITDYLLNRHMCVSLISRADKYFGPQTTIINNWAKKYDRIFVKGER